MKLPDFPFKIKYRMNTSTYLVTQSSITHVKLDWKNEDTPTGWDHCFILMSSLKEGLESGCYTIVEDPHYKYPETPYAKGLLLEKMKSFTKDTGASIFICDGNYEVYYDCDFPAKASTDEQLEKLMEAFKLIDDAY